MNPKIKNIAIPVAVVAFALLAYVSLSRPDVGGGPDRPRVPVPMPEAAAPQMFGVPVTLAPSETAIFEGGVTVRVGSIDDSRCKPDVVCMWQGELSAELIVSGEAYSASVRLGTETALTGSAAGYDLTLLGLTETAVTFAVTPAAMTPIATSDDRIRVTTPTSGQLVTSPLAISGEAMGTWYFEASFPVKLLDEDGSQLAMAPAQALGEWMTLDFVPYKLSLPFPTPKGKVGTLVLMRDNPSGEPENDAEVRIPVRFMP